MTCSDCRLGRNIVRTCLDYYKIIGVVSSVEGEKKPSTAKSRQSRKAVHSGALSNRSFPLHPPRATSSSSEASTKLNINLDVQVWLYVKLLFNSPVKIKWTFSLLLEEIKTFQIKTQFSSLAQMTIFVLYAYSTNGLRSASPLRSTWFQWSGRLLVILHNVHHNEICMFKL